LRRYRTLRNFAEDELLFNEEETRIILRFIFRPADHPVIHELPMTDKLRGFAQGLLVEAIDLSFAVGFVESVFRSSANPAGVVRRLIKWFGRQSSLQWYRFAKAADLQDIRVYQFVLDELARNYRSRLREFFAAMESDSVMGAFISLKTPRTARRTWQVVG